MWHWEQGRLEYFQFDVLRRIARFSLQHDLAAATRDQLRAAVGMPFDPAGYTPWRNYQRVFRLMMITGAFRDGARPTPVAALLAEPGAVTADEYLHFVAQAATEPSPALSGYAAATRPRYPLLFSLKYLLTKAAAGSTEPTAFDEIQGAYAASGLAGDEDGGRFHALLAARGGYAALAKAGDQDLRRQARESLRVMAQISYLHIEGQQLFASIAAADAAAAFAALQPVGGPRDADPGREIERRAGFFRGAATQPFLDLSATLVGETVEAGFAEGGRVEQTHLVVERNAKLRAEYFRRFDPVRCDVCALDTRTSYPWATQVLDLHHIMPLASGTRVGRGGTTFDDLVPLCPTCHRAVHRFYGTWLRERERRDFETAGEARDAYDQVKRAFAGHRYA